MLAGCLSCFIPWGTGSTQFYAVDNCIELIMSPISSQSESDSLQEVYYIHPRPFDATVGAQTSNTPKNSLLQKFYLGPNYYSHLFPPSLVCLIIAALVRALRIRCSPNSVIIVETSCRQAASRCLECALEGVPIEARVR